MEVFERVGVAREIDGIELSFNFTSTASEPFLYH